MSKDTKLALYTMVNAYLTNKVKHAELEIRFGTNPKQKLTKIDYDHVVTQLMNAGYVCDGDSIAGVHLLRISPQLAFLNKSEEIKTSKLRAEIVGIDLIEQYCKLGDDLNALVQTKTRQIQFTLKSNVMPSVDVVDFGFRASYQNEHHSAPSDPKNLY